MTKLVDRQANEPRFSLSRSQVSPSCNSINSAHSLSSAGHIAAQVRRHCVRHDQLRHPHRFCHALDGRYTRIALAAFNLRQMLRRHAHLGRKHLQRQTTLAAQEGGNQSVYGRYGVQLLNIRSYDRVNSDRKIISPSRQLHRRLEQIWVAIEVGSGGADAAVPGQRLEQVNGNALVC